MEATLLLLFCGLLWARAHYLNEAHKPCDFCCFRQMGLCDECKARLRPEGIPGVTRCG